MNAIALREPLNIFLKEIDKYPVLTKEGEYKLALSYYEEKEEYKLALSYYEEKDLEAANTLVVSNLRFVVKIAREYLSYGFALSDLVQEGTIGLMKAVKKFDPFKGYRLISYAVWWIRAGIQNHIMKFWSQVKIGTTQAQIKNNEMTEQEVSKVAELFGVKNKDVIDMEFRMASRDYSLDATSTEDNTVSYLDILSDGKANQEKVIESIETNDLAHQGITDGLKKLSPREKKVIESRYLKNPPEKLRELGEELGISKERVRQIEVHALKKLKGAVETVISNGT